MSSSGPRAILWEGAIIILILWVDNTSWNQESTQEASHRAHALTHFHGSFCSMGRLCGLDQLDYILPSPLNALQWVITTNQLKAVPLSYSRALPHLTQPQFSILISQSP